MIKVADVLFLPAAFVVAVAAQLGVLLCLGPLLQRAEFFTLEMIVASLVLVFACWCDFLRCRTGHAARFLIAPVVAAGMTWATILPSIIIICLIKQECL